jgi:uncharacterized protein
LAKVIFLCIFAAHSLKEIGNNMATIIGREQEIKKLDQLVQSPKSEFLAVYGRRRVGKTFLVRNYFDNTFDFYTTGLAKGNTQQQLTNFTVFINNYFSKDHEVPSNWMLAFNLLIKELERTKTEKKRVLFFDEMPWIDTKKSDFMMGLEFFWNAWASVQNNILLIVCGSAASWMINNLIHNTGGLYNRVTERLRIEPFTLYETELFFGSKNIVLDRYQIIQLYMVMGGIPFYLDHVEHGKSAMQNIEHLCFKNDGKLRKEFSFIFASLFRNPHKHETVLQTIFDSGGALTREELLGASSFTSGGNISKVLGELEESGFITVFPKFGSQKTNMVYVISDFYTNFYLKFIRNAGQYEPNMWMNNLDNPAYRAWSGLAFEHVCFAHIAQIKMALGIAGVSSSTYSWYTKGDGETKGSQIDLVIDRRDQVINLFEIKYSIHPVTVTKAYDTVLRHKIQSFKEGAAVNTKSVFLTLLTTHGLTENEYSRSCIQNELTMHDLFLPT